MLAGASNAVAALSINECPNLFGTVCFGPSSGMCSKPCNFWDEHPADGYKHCVETTCGWQIALPCNNNDPDQPGKRRQQQRHVRAHLASADLAKQHRLRR